MGFCFSCCRRGNKGQDKQTDVERQPLLRTDTDALRHAETPYEKATDVLAALNSGKLPSQQQLDVILKRLLRSGMLEITPEEEQSALDESGKKVIMDAREVVNALLQVGLEKNDDNRIQDLLYQLRELSSKSVPVNVDSPPEIRVSSEVADHMEMAASAIPSQNELTSDAIALVSSFRTLATLFLTSSAFRLMLGDLLLTTREFIADAAQQVRKAAENVEQVSEVIEANVRPGLELNGHDVSPTSESPPVAPTSESMGHEIKPPKDVVLDRLEDIFRQAQASPRYNAALRTLLYILRKYAERVSLASAAISEASDPSSGESAIQLSAPVISPDPRFSRALEDLRILLERFAGGKSLEPLLRSLFQTVHDITVLPANGDSSDVRSFFRKAGEWLDTALANPSFATSRAGREAASRLYDEGSDLLTQDTQLSNNLQHLSDETNSFTDGLKADRSTNKLLRALESLHSDTLTLLGRAAETGQRTATHWRTTLLRVSLGWLLPRLLRAVRTIPMPRFEYVSSSSTGTRIEAAVDALLLSAEEALVPDVISVQQFAEVRVEVDESVGSVELTSPNARLLSARKSVDGGQGNPEEPAMHVSLLGDGNNADEVNGDAGLSKSRRKKTNVTTTTRVRVHIEGLRVAAHDVGYYASYAQNSWLGYTDEGLLSVDIGRGQRRGEGLALDIELEMDSDSSSNSRIHTSSENNEGGKENIEVFRVLDVQTSIPGLALQIAHSRHWILNSLLLSPFAGPIGRLVGPRILNAQIRGALKKLEEVLRDVKGKADDKAETRRKHQAGLAEYSSGEGEVAWSDWWDALLEKFGAATGEQKESELDEFGEEDEGHQEEEEQAVHTETRTEATLTGVVRTTIEQPQSEPGQDIEASQTENAIAVGLGSQLLPGKAEPTTLGVERESPQQAAQEVAETAREAVEDVRENVRNVREGVQGAAHKGVEEAVRVRRMAEDAEERLERQERREKKKGGWRSRAFDL